MNPFLKNKVPWGPEVLHRREVIHLDEQGRPCRAAVEEWGKALDCIRHGFTKVMMLLVLSGRGRLEANDESWTFGDNHLLLLMPGKGHRIIIDTPLRLILVESEDYFFVEACRKHLSSRSTCWPVFNVTRLQEMMNLIYHLMEDRGALAAKTCQALRMCLVDLLVEGRQARMDLMGEDQKWLRASWHWMHSHYQEPLGVTEMAADLGIHRSRLCRIWSKLEGQSPSAMLSSIRLGKARELLAETTMALGDVALCCGYQDPFTFSKAFKRWSSQSPQQWRKSFLKT